MRCWRICRSVAASERESRALAYLKREGIERGDAKAIVAECFAVLDHPEFAPLFTPTSRAEVGVTALLPELREFARQRTDRPARGDR